MSAEQALRDRLAEASMREFISLGNPVEALQQGQMDECLRSIAGMSYRLADFMLKARDGTLWPDQPES